MKNLKFIISGGGTGGHIYPAIAIANELKMRYPQAEFLFVGAKGKMEMQKVPQQGYQIVGLWIAGLQRRITADNLLFPVKLLSSLLKARTIIGNFKPDVVIGTGGFASGPLLQVAGIAGIPTVIQEQNSYPGITNKILGKRANVICVAYENLDRFFNKNKVVLTGNPVRQDLLRVRENRDEAIKFYNLDPSKKTVVVLGGSLGARRINQLIASEAVNFAAQDVQVIWQCGKLYWEDYKQYNDSTNIQVISFVDRMDLLYAAADIIISRAGASSVSELALAGKPTIFIPSPNVAEDHQTKNAMAIVEKEGAILIKEAELETKFSNVFTNLLGDRNLQIKISENFRKLATPDATSRIADEIEKLIKNNVKK